VSLKNLFLYWIEVNSGLLYLSQICLLMFRLLPILQSFTFLVIIAHSICMKHEQLSTIEDVVKKVPYKVVHPFIPTDFVVSSRHGLYHS